MMITSPRDPGKACILSKRQNRSSWQTDRRSEEQHVHALCTANFADARKKIGQCLIKL